VARAATAGGEKLLETTPEFDADGLEIVAEETEKMPTDKLVDVSPLALRMSSPFNAGYWLAAA
jgi:hypothetical protein